MAFLENMNFTNTTYLSRFEFYFWHFKLGTGTTLTSDHKSILFSGYASLASRQAKPKT
jgi:hypothetical protein